MSSDIQMVNVEGFDDSNHHNEAMNVILEMELNQLSGENGHIYEITPISVTPDASNSILEVITNEPFGQQTRTIPISATQEISNGILDVNTHAPFHQIELQTIVTPISATTETSNNILDINSIPIREDNLLDPNFSTPSYMEEQSCHSTIDLVNGKIRNTVETSTSYQSNSSTDGVLDLSVVSNATNTESKETLKDFGTFKDVFTVPTFNGKNKKTKSKSGEHSSVPVSTRDDMLKMLEKKDNEQKLKEQQIWQNKKEKEKLRKLREKEHIVNKDFKERKKKIVQKKKEINLEIKNLNKILKSKDEKENKSEIADKQKNLSAQLAEIERLLVNHEMEILQEKLKIKQEKL